LQEGKREVSLIKEKKYDHPSIVSVESLSEKLIVLTLQLEDKNRQLEQSELARKKMFSNITHDLRAPIAVIRGAAERLGHEGIGVEERLKMVRIINSRAATLEHLIEDMYISALLDQPEFSLSPVRLEIAPILEEYFISMEGAGRFDGRDNKLEIPDGFSECVMIDLRYFFRVLDNLLSNALTHTKPGNSIELGCRVNDGSIEIFVADSGSGIKPSDMPNIFDRTFSGAAARTPGKAGSGLGLSISRTIVEKHGGALRCDSVYGEGSTFTISLPLVRCY